jgi:hypothetical protein
VEAVDHLRAAEAGDCPLAAVEEDRQHLEKEAEDRPEKAAPAVAEDRAGSSCAGEVPLVAAAVLVEVVVLPLQV